MGRTLLVTICFLASGRVSADDRVSLRGVYFREASTRVIEPMVQVSKDAPGGVDVNAHYLLDAVTSASVAAGAGALTGGRDVIFTEWRHQVGMGGGYTFDRTRLGAQLRYSNEPDYKSRAFGLSLAQGVWENTGTLSVNLARGWDRIIARAIDDKLDTWFASVGYTQALSPVALLQAGYEFSLLDGYQANPYLDTPQLGRPRLPRVRRRHVLSLKGAYYFPEIEGGVQLHYRLYLDGGSRYQDTSGMNQPQPWGIGGHTVEGRFYKTVARDFELRASYRVHKQTQANFWCNADPSQGGNVGCYDPQRTVYHSYDPKLGALTTHMPELQVAWRLRWFARVPVLRFFAPGTAEVSYARLIQSTRYGGAHLLQVGYTLPF